MYHILQNYTKVIFYQTPYTGKQLFLNIIAGHGNEQPLDLVPRISLPHLLSP